MRVTVYGSGSWGTALALLLSRNGHDVVLVGRSSEEIDQLRIARENLRYLPGFILPASVSFSLVSEVEPGAELSVLAVPSTAVRELVQHSQVRQASKDSIVVVAAKGIEAVTGKLVTEVLSELEIANHIGVLSGPNLAIEVVRGVPTAALSAFEDVQVAEQVRRAFTCSTYRIYTTTDIVGVELAGAMKNVLAIAAGISDGLGFGNNTKGALLARGLREMLILGNARGASYQTFLGIAGVGDLFATATSNLSRNYRVGVGVGKGQSLRDVLEGIGQVAEGVSTSEAILHLCRQCEIELPLFTAVDAILRGLITPQRGVSLLMERDKPEEDIPLPVIPNL